MSRIDDFLNRHHAQVDSTMGTKSVVCEGQEFVVVWDDHRKSADGGLSGIEPQILAYGTAQPLTVSNPKALLGKRCTVGDEQFRVFEVYPGTVAIRFAFCAPSENR